MNFFQLNQILLTIHIFDLVSISLIASVVKRKAAEFEVKKVCIIGAGPSGLTIARHLSESTDKFDIAVFEQNSDVGGQWLYTEETGTTKYGYPVHSSIYRDLWTNVPKRFMTFPDYDLDAPSWTRLPHAVVLEYLRNYTKHFDLKRFIQFNTRVLNVKLNSSKDSAEKWKVQIKNLEANTMEEIICDNVVVCNGHVSAPNIPKIPGIENFKGMSIHSQSYRKPETFTGKRVVLLGAGDSGRDIASQLNKAANKVYLSHRSPPNQPEHNYTEVSGIVRFKNGKFVLQDNSTLEVDAIIFCTGYKTEFPFLDDSAGITVDDNFVSPLYKHIINVQHPSMSFIGIISPSVNFPIFDTQSQYVASVLKGNARFPPRKDMMENANLQPSNKRYGHLLSDERAYIEELALEGGFEINYEY